MGAPRPPGHSGILAVDKPAGWTSHDVVARCRKLLATRKVGHSGTLDPGATGVLVLGVGVATRLLRYLTPLPKAYEATIRFGIETSTLDADGDEVARHDMSGITPAAVAGAAADFVGEIQQVPPMVSAVKVGGRRLHELAREGIEVDRAPRPVTVTRFDLFTTDEPLTYRAVVECSSGTYVRTLAADLGHALGGGAHLTSLRRTAVGGFGLGDAVALDDVEVSKLLPITRAVAHLASVSIDEDLAAAVRVGKVLPAGSFAEQGLGPWAVLSATDGALLAVYQRHRGDSLKPELVLGHG